MAQSNRGRLTRYELLLDNDICKIAIPQETVLCDNIRCCSDQHRNDVDELCKTVVSTSIQTSKRCILQMSNYLPKNIAYWIKEVKPLEDSVLFWHWLWYECGKIDNGAVYDVMKHTIHKYHYAIRAAKKHDSDLRKQRLAESYANNNSKDMWKELKHMHTGKIVAGIVDNVSIDEDIADVFVKKYQLLYASVRDCNFSRY